MSDQRVGLLSTGMIGESTSCLDENYDAKEGCGELQHSAGAERHSHFRGSRRRL